MILAEVRQRLLDHLLAGDRPGAAAVVGEARERGVDGGVLIDQVLTPVMAEVGTRWLRNEWSVAQEHAATSVVDALLGRLELEPPVVVPVAGTVVGVCATGEWHVTPLRLVAEVLRRRGLVVRVLGASVPPDHLAEYLRLHPTSAVLVSCSISRFLPGAAAVVRAAHTAGVPVLAGGAAFGGDGRRAAMVGADAFAVTTDEAVAVVTAWARQRPALATPQVPGDAGAKGPMAARVGAAVAELPDPACWTGLGPVEDLVRDVLQALDAAALLHDPSLLLDELDWMHEAMRLRPPGPEVVDDVARAVLRAEQPAAPVGEVLAARVSAAGLSG